VYWGKGDLWESVDSPGRIKGGGQWLIGWLATPLSKKQKNEEIEINCEYCSRNEGKHSGQLPHCNFFFMVLLAFVV